MFGNLFNKNTKKEDEYNEYEDEGNFSYNEDLKTNEFNDATIEYGDGEEIEEEIFDEDPRERDKNKILFYGLIGLLILLLIIVLLIRGCVLTDGKLKQIKLTAPDIIYVGEREKIKVSASGSGNLKNTIYKFDTSNNSIVEIEAKGYVKGKTATDYLIPITTGKFVLQVSGQLDDVKLPGVEKEIVICRRLTKESFNSEELTAVINKPIKLNVDLGDDVECFNNLKYEIKDTSLVKVDENGNLVGLKKGKTVITFKNGDDEITKVINVVTNSTEVKGLEINKRKVTLTVGQSEQLKATINPANATNKNIKWTSSNEGIVTVSNNGKLTGVGQGSAIVKAATEDGNYSKLISVTVNKKPTATKPGSTGPSTPIDKTAPKLTSVKIYSNNQYKMYAKKGDKITIEVSASEPLGAKPSIIVANQPVTTTCSGTTCKATYTVVNPTPEGNIRFSIKSYKDMSGNTGEVVTKTTDKSNVFVDKTQPSCYASGQSSTKTEATVKFTWSDSLSGVRYVAYPDGNNYSASVVGKKIDGSRNFNFKFQSSQYNVSMKVTDWAGNSSNCSYAVVANQSFTPKTFTASFVKGSGVSSIATNSLSCTTTASKPSSCTVTAPRIYGISNFNVLGWSTYSSASSASYNVGSSITLSSNSTFYTVTSKKSSIPSITLEPDYGDDDPNPGSGSGSSSGSGTTSCGSIGAPGRHTYLGMTYTVNDDCTCNSGTHCGSDGKEYNLTPSCVFKATGSTCGGGGGSTSSKIECQKTTSYTNSKSCETACFGTCKKNGSRYTCTTTITVNGTSCPSGYSIVGGGSNPNMSTYD